MDQVERTTEVKYNVSRSYDDGKDYDTLKEARAYYNKMESDEWDGVFLRKVVTEVTTITTITSIQSK